MTTIAENLLTLNETKQAIKMAIEGKGQDLTGVPFTNYPEKISAIAGGGSIIKPLTITSNGVYDTTTFGGELLYETTVKLKDRIDMSAVREALENSDLAEYNEIIMGNAIYEDDGYREYAVVKYTGQDVTDTYVSGIDYYIRENDYEVIYRYVDDLNRKFVADWNDTPIPDGFVGWWDVVSGTVGKNLEMPLPSKQVYNESGLKDALALPLSQVESLIFEDSILTKGYDGANPITVDVPLDYTIKPLTITANGVYDMTIPSLKYGETVYVKNEIDVDTLVNLIGRDLIIDFGGLGLMFSEWHELFIEAIPTNVEGEYVFLLGIYKYTEDGYGRPFFYINEGLFRIAELEEFPLPEGIENTRGWVALNEDGTAFEVVTNVEVDCPLQDNIDEFIEYAGELLVVPINEYLAFFYNDFYREACDGANPITVEVPPPVDYIDTSDATAWASDIKKGCTAYARGVKITGTHEEPPATSGIQKIIDKRRSASHLFSNYLDYNGELNTIIGELNFSKVTNISRMCFNCTSALTKVPTIDTSNVTDASYAFDSCRSLTMIGELDMRNCSNFMNFVYDCKNLTDMRIKNIKANLSIYGGGISSDSPLPLENIIYLIKELRKTGSTKKFNVGPSKLQDLAETYVRTIPITDEMRVADDLVDEKLPFEVCESTDEGAMLITDYVAFKNWEIT